MKVYYLKHNAKIKQKEGVYFSMNIITEYDLAQISVEQVIIYLRKSRSERNETVEEVLARHEKILQDYAIQVFGQKIPEANIYREVVSGETLDERIEIKKVFGRLENEPIRALLVVEPQRISRGGMTDCGRVVDILRYTDTWVVTVTKTYNLENKFDRQLFEAQLTQGNQYLEYHKEIMDRGKNLSIREGKYVASTAPFGYDRKPLDRGFMLIKHKEEAPIVETIFNLFVDEDLSTHEIADYLNKHQMKPRKNKLWDYEKVRHVMKNEVYYGSTAWGKRPTVRKLINGEITKIRISAEDYMLVRGKHDPIVSKEKWDLAQEKIKGNPSSRTGLNRELQNPLAGLVFCKKCGYSLVRVKNSRGNIKRKKRRKYELNKPELNAFLRKYKEMKGVSYKQIAEFLDVKKHNVVAWFDPRPDHNYYSDLFTEKWYELKFFLEIDDDTFDKQIMTYIDPPPLNDTFMCSNQHCDMVASCLQRIEREILEDLRKQLADFKYYVSNYEKEIVKEQANKQKSIARLNNKIKELKTELKNLRRAYNREEFTYEEYLEDKQDIESELNELMKQLEEFENDDDSSTLVKYKKAIPNLEECLLEYDKLSIPQKNENLKSIIEKITYSKTKRLNWRVEDEDDLELHIDLKL